MLSALILSVVAPSVVAAVLLGAGHLALGGIPAGERSGRWAQALAPALGALAAYVAVSRIPDFPPIDATQWALFLALAAAAFGLVDSLLAIPEAVRWVVRLGFGAIVPYLLLRPMIEHSFDTSEAAAWIAAGAVVLSSAWWAIDRAAERTAGLGLPAALTVVGAGVATLLGTHGSALLAQSTGGLTAAVGVAAALGLLRPRAFLVRSMAPALAVGFTSMLLMGVNYSETPWFAALVLGVAPLAIGLVPAAPTTSSLKSTLAFGGVAAATAAIALGLAFGLPQTKAPPSSGADPSAENQNDSGYDPDYGY